MRKTVRFDLIKAASIMLFVTSILAVPPLLAATGQCVKPPVNDRPRIGLVLGGGGARGYAHIGVIKKLEELRVPYDYIAGTSMGSIVGGFLSTGMQSDELDKVVRDADWDDLFKDSTEREDLPYRRKADDALGLFGPKLGIGKDSSLLPRGVVSGQKVIFMFESVASQRVNTSNFDQLPISFRAIATDIVSGEMVIIADGELSMAMRASMAVPAVFDPVRRGDHLLVDGGLVRNLPVDVAREMGADVIIAVDVGTKLAGDDELKNALAIVYQISGMLTVQNTETQIKTLGDKDVLISPKLGNEITSADFKKLDAAIPIGYAAAEAVQEQLQKYALSESEYRAWRQQINQCVEGPPSVHFVELINKSRFSDEVIRELISIRPGETLDLEQLDKDLRQIYALGFIRQARYNIIEKDGQQGIEITVFQDERGDRFIETGLDLSFSGRGTDFNLRAGYLDTGLDTRGSEFRALIQFGESPGLFADYYRPLDDGLKYSLRPSVALFRRPIFVYDDEGNAIGEIEVDEVGAAIALGREFGRYAKITTGFSRYAGKLDVLVGNPDLSSYSFDGAELFVELGIDRLDDRYLPTRGFYTRMKYTTSLESLGADVDFDQFEFSLYASHTFGAHNLIWGGQYNVSLEDNPSINSWYTGGGFLNMSGFEPNSLIGQHFGHVLGGYRYQVGKSGFLPGYAGMTVEYGNAAQNRSDIFSEGFLNGSFYLAYSSPLGPVYLGLGWSEDRSPIYFLRLGTVFGPRSLGRR